MQGLTGLGVTLGVYLGLGCRFLQGLGVTFGVAWRTYFGPKRFQKQLRPSSDLTIVSHHMSYPKGPWTQIMGF